MHLIYTIAHDFSEVTDLSFYRFLTSAAVSSSSRSSNVGGGSGNGSISSFPI